MTTATATEQPRPNVLENPAYIEGVRKARERHEALTDLCEKRLEDLRDYHRQADKPAAAEAKKRAEARRKRYGA